jgi:hypothetical protein
MGVMKRNLKRGGGKSNCKNERNISLINTDLKVFARITKDFRLVRINSN